MSVLPARSDAQDRVATDLAIGCRLPTQFAVVGVDTLRTVIPEWDRLSASSANNSFTQSPWFAQIVWAHQRAARQELLVVVGRDDAGALCALLPMVRERSRMPILGLDVLRPLALFGTEVSAPVLGEDVQPAATTRMVEFLLGADGPACDMVEFDAVALGSDLHFALQEVAATLDQPFLQGATVVSPMVHPTVATGGAELPGPSARFRRNLRRAWRRVAASGHDVECREISWEWQRWQDEVARIYAARWGHGSPATSLALQEPRRLALVDTLLSRLDRHFRAHVFGCFVDQNLAAYVVCLRGGEEARLWATGMDAAYRQLGVGTLLWDSCLHGLAALPGVRRISLGKGDERFKLAWSDSSYPVASATVVRAGGLKRRRALLRQTTLGS